MDGSTLRYKAFLIACGKRIAIWKQCVYCPTSHLERRTAGRHHTRAVHCARCTVALSSSSTRPLTRTAGLRRSVARHSRIHRSKPGVVHFDGDPMMMGENVDVKIMKKGLQVIVPGMRKKTFVSCSGHKTISTD